MKNLLYSFYAYMFGRAFFSKLNTHLFNLSLRGLGVLNYKDDNISGEENFLKNLIKSTDSLIVFDVGANVGNYSKKVLKSNPKALVYAFEPHPVNFNKLNSNISSKNFNSYNVGVGVEKSDLILYDYSNNDGSSHASLFKGVIEDIHLRKSVEHKVPVISLSDFLFEHNISRIDLLKIDTEGNELNVIKGLQEAINKNVEIKTIHFEFNEMNIISKVSFKDFWDLLPAYSFYRLLPKGRLLPITYYSPILCELYAYQNIIAIKNK